MRRLITLISAGRNRTIVVRRELPLTRDAGWVRRPDRIKVRRILLSVSSRSITCAAPTMSWLKPPLMNPGGRIGRPGCCESLPNLVSGHLVRLRGGRQLDALHRTLGAQPSGDSGGGA